MNAAQIKDEIRKLNRTDKIEIYRWIDEEAASDLLARIGVQGNRTEVESVPTRRGGISSLIKGWSKPHLLQDTSGVRKKAAYTAETNH
jgi:hypothetical protein